MTIHEPLEHPLEPHQRNRPEAPLQHAEAIGALSLQYKYPSVDSDLDQSSPHSTIDSSEPKSQRTPTYTSAKPQTEAIVTYLNEIGQIPLLDADDEVRLGREVQDGLLARQRLMEPPTDYDPLQQQSDMTAVQRGLRAKKDFINANLRLVVSIAKRYPPAATHGTPLLDLIQQGNLGLEHAVDKFDPEQGFKFSTYATWWIRQSIGRYLDENFSEVTVPRRLAGETIRYIRFLERSEHKPTDEEILEEFQWDPEKLRKIRAAHTARTTSSLSAPVGDGTNSLEDLIADPASGRPEYDKVLDSICAEALWRTLETVLNRQEILCLASRFTPNQDKDVPFRQIGLRLGVKTEQARRIYNRAMEKLWAPENRELLDGLRDLLSE